MAKHKPAVRIQNKPIYSRMSYLYQAAAFLAQLESSSLEGANQGMGESGAQGQEQNKKQSSSSDKGKSKDSVNGIMARRLLSDLRAVSLKTQIRIDPSIKRTVCKFCDSALVEGQSCTSVVENKSKNGKKPWADILVLKCGTCGHEKRFPVSAPRQKRRPFREVNRLANNEEKRDGEAVKNIPAR